MACDLHLLQIQNTLKNTVLVVYHLARTWWQIQLCQHRIKLLVSHTMWMLTRPFIVAMTWNQNRANNYQILLEKQVLLINGYYNSCSNYVSKTCQHFIIPLATKKIFQLWWILLQIIDSELQLHLLQLFKRYQW